MICDAVGAGRFRRACGSTCTARWSPSASRTARANCCAASAPSTRRRRSCVAYDMHANFYDAMVEQRAGRRRLPDLSAYRQRETAERAGARAAAGDARRGEADHGLGQRADAAARHGAGHRTPSRTRTCRRCARHGRASGRALAASLFVGFPHADIEKAGLSRRRRHRQRPRRCRRPWCDELIDVAWKARARLHLRDRTAERIASRRAKAMGATRAELPVVLLDHYDNCACGGTMDTTDVLAEIIRQGLDDVAVLRHLRSGGGGSRRCGRRRRRGHAVDRRQAGDAGDLPASSRAADRHRHGARRSRPGVSVDQGGPDRRGCRSIWARPWCWIPARSRSC